MSPSQFARISGLVGSPLPSMNPKLLQGRVGQMVSPASGFRAFFGAPPPPAPPSAQQQQHPPCPGSHLQNLRYHILPLDKQMGLCSVCRYLVAALPQKPICSGHSLSSRSQPQMFRPDTTHLHPQHRRLLHQRQQQNRK